MHLLVRHDSCVTLHSGAAEHAQQAAFRESHAVAAAHELLAPPPFVTIVTVPVLPSGVETGRQRRWSLEAFQPGSLGSLRNYVGSVAVSADREVIAVSSPEGDSVLAIDATALRPSATLTLRDGCGLAPDGAGFLASSGAGELTGFAGSTAPDRRLGIKFDNHLRLFRS